MKLEMFKNELKTRQKTIETLRFDFIKASQDGDTRYLDGDSKDLGFFKIQRASSRGPLFYPINPPDTYEPARKENLSPNHKVALARSLVQKAQVQHTDHAPRFNYEEYMKKLRERLNLEGQGANAGVGATDF